MRLTIDFECRSPVDIKKAGPWVYAEHPDTDVMCLAFKIDDEIPGLWIPDRYGFLGGLKRLTGAGFEGVTSTSELRRIVRRADIIEAHNAEFERSIWRRLMMPRYGWDNVPDRTWRCSAAKAAAFGLPRSLDGAAKALKLPVEKDQEGYRLMLKMCRPRKPRKGEAPGLYWHEDPEDLKRLFQYCVQDVVTEHALSAVLPDLSPKEQEVWFVDQAMNERGILADVDSSTVIIHAIDEYKKDLEEALADLTFGQITTAKQAARIAEYCGLPNVTKATVAAALDTDLNTNIRRVLEIRRELGLSSISKFDAILDRACRDKRLRANAMYHGAVPTGRWAGKGVQLQNLPRAGIDPDAFELALGLFQDRDFVWMENLFGRDPIALAQALIRPMIMASPGHDLVCADFSSVEARVLMWLAGQRDGIEFFKSGADIYCEMASTIYDGRPISKKDKIERQVGKHAILGLGYGMGAPKFIITCKVQGNIDVDKKLARRAVKAYRGKFPNVRQLWYNNERVAIEAVGTEKPVECGPVTWLREDRWLFCILPSGRRLVYPYPALIVEPAFIYPCVNEDGDETTVMIVGKQNLEARLKKRLSDEDLKCIGKPIEREKSILTHMGVAQGQWVRESTYGGKLVENIDQATARDLMAEAMLRHEAAGYKVLMSVHDEIIAEAPEGFGSVEEFERIMAELPPWAAGCPVAAEGWRGKRYRK